MRNTDFVQIVWDYYRSHGRSELPWRIPDKNGYYNPYKILVSEMMLQQTQVARVVPKYEAFVAAFPDVTTLASAHFKQLLQLWSGLGYTRRAKYLHEIAKQLVVRPFPATVESLSVFKGIGINTAAAVLVYSYNQPHVFVETNIRTVILYHYFQDQDGVDDKYIIEKLKNIIGTLPETEYRDFYWAIMDYGTHLKSQGVRNNNQSKHYAKQTAFAGSRRQVRGNVMRYLASSSHNVVELSELQRVITDERAQDVIQELSAEGFICIAGDTISLQ